MDIVVTGPTGAIGQAVIRTLLSEDADARILAICRKGSKRRDTLPADDRVSVVELDLDQYGKVDEDTITSWENAGIPVKYDVFYHLAWQGTVGASRNDMQMQQKNIQYALDSVLLAKSLGCTAYIGAGSQAEYGRVNGNLNPETPAFPENGYGIAKLAAGQMTRMLCKQNGIKHIWARILSVYGPYDGAESMIMSTIRKMLNEEETAFTPGEQQWDYLYSKDAAEFLLRLPERGKDENVYCLGSGTAKELKEYIFEIYRCTERMKNKTEISLHNVDMEKKLGIGKIPYAEKQVMHLCADTGDLTNDTGYQCRYGFEQGMEETVRWYYDAFFLSE